MKPDLIDAKRNFLAKVKVSNLDHAMRNSIRAGLQHNPTYSNLCSQEDRKVIRHYIATHIQSIIPAYKNGHFSEDFHISKIIEFSELITEQFRSKLVNSRFRIGTSQKILNLYLKFLWCFEHIEKCPLHCPVDRIILNRINIFESWTQCDDINQYKNWIKKLKEITNDVPLQQWELEIWNDN